MAIALQVLKIIGIILLCVLGFLLALILLLLFWPYGYRVRASKYEDLRAQAGVTWLLHIVTADLLYEDGINFRIRLFGLPFYDKKRKAKKAAERERKQEEEEEKRLRKLQEEWDKEKEGDEAAGAEERKESETPEAVSGSETELSEDVETIKESEAGASCESGEEDHEKPRERKQSHLFRKKRLKNSRTKKTAGTKDGSGRDGSKAQERPSFTDWCEEKLEQAADKAEALADSIKEGTWKIGDTIDGAFDTFHYYERVLESDGTAWVVDYVKKHGLAIVKPFKPRCFELDLDYRSEDPVQIAKVMQYYALSIPLTDEIRGSVRVTALPDEDLIQGRTSLTGSFVLGPILWHAFLLWKNKKVRHFIKVIKREQDPGGGKVNGRKQK